MTTRRLQQVHPPESAPAEVGDGFGIEIAASSPGRWVTFSSLSMPIDLSESMMRSPRENTGGKGVNASNSKPPGYPASAMS